MHMSTPSSATSPTPPSQMLAVKVAAAGKAADLGFVVIKLDRMARTVALIFMQSGG